MAIDQLQWCADGNVRDKVEIAIKRLKAFEPPEGYYVAFSGGKDSQCVYHLCKMAGVKFDAHYSVTSVDPPELVRFIKKNYPDVVFGRKHDKNGKPVTMWSLIVQNAMPPTRLARFCCKALKESDGVDRYTVTGVRAEESTNRKANQGVITLPNAGKKFMEKLNEASIKYTETKRGGVILNYDNDSERRLTEFCNRTSKRLLNPIIDWSEEDVWEFLNRNGIEHCCLYDEGFARIGCIGCPMGRPVRQKREFERWPQYKKLYLKAFGKMIEERKRKGLPTEKWRTPEEVMGWWLQDENG